MRAANRTSQEPERHQFDELRKYIDATPIAIPEGLP
jgi:hypothetical protein